MCNYMQREYKCGHFRWIANRWYRDYTITHKRCQPDVTDFEDKAEDCSECKPKVPPPWERMIARNN
ncbi:hypothetical protein MMYC01_209298 [Madurella mycetomatis]|uniref:Uncharacterized protein n=1 Tax=Madurella mycetomatis TaxID=100816 RepID=A0A175VZ05_9PEZI|nr:hypothetical protein MMYC01_209298 [Madurella mycetomatis]